MRFSALIVVFLSIFSRNFGFKATRRRLSMITYLQEKQSKGDDFNGRDKRAIRAIAAKMTQLKSAGAEDLLGRERLEVVVAKHCHLEEENFVGNLVAILNARELVKIKVLGKDIKKKSVKEAAEVLCEKIPGASVAQIVGHTALLYKQKDGGFITELLASELEKT